MVRAEADIGEHQRQILENLAFWEAKPVLREIYRDFHRLLAAHLADVPGEIVELGSGIGNIREVIPSCARTDLFPNPWIDRCEDIYRLGMADASVSNLILFDVFHHLRHPLDALDECHRVLRPGGRLLVFDHAMSAAGFLFSKFCHHERPGFLRPYALRSDGAAGGGYYADHANAWRIFQRRADELLSEGWERVALVRMPAVRWVLSGGYRGPDLASKVNPALLQAVERALSCLPDLTALRLLVVLERLPDAR